MSEDNSVSSWKDFSSLSDEGLRDLVKFWLRGRVFEWDKAKNGETEIPFDELFKRLSRCRSLLFLGLNRKDNIPLVSFFSCLVFDIIIHIHDVNESSM